MSNMGFYSVALLDQRQNSDAFNDSGDEIESSLNKGKNVTYLIH